MSSARSIAGVFALATAMVTASGAEAALTIGGGATENVICATHICRAIRPTAVLNATQLATMLALSDVTVVSGSKAQDLVVHTAFSWTSSHRLTLDSYRSITVDYSVTVAGLGGVTLTTNDGGSGGTFTTQFPGRIDFWDLSSSLVINGMSYTLVGDIATLASDINTHAFTHYALAKNYDARTDGIYIGSPIATDFSGSFEGLGHVISHLTIDAGPAYVGTALFAEFGGQIENIGLTGASIRGELENTVGSLVAYNGGSIYNSFAKTLIRGGTTVGGLVGRNGGSIASSYTTGQIISGSGYAELGGLVGADTGVVRDSHSSAKVVETSSPTSSVAGGLIGYLEGSLTDSWASGAVSVGSSYSGNWWRFEPASAGGLVGWYQGPGSVVFKNCYATGTATAGEYSAVGGLIGTFLNDRDQPPIALLDDNYASSQLSGGWHIGGVIGVLFNDGNISDNYWDMDTSGVTDPRRGIGDVWNWPGVTGLSDAQLTSGLPAGFDPTVWAENPSINGGRPYLIANPPTP